ncbi:MAG: hypothetical protein V3W34_13640 [Phycisphaerae bacterium]
MKPRTLIMPEIRREGLQALVDRLGPAGTLRFLQQYDPGRGDYTKDRHTWLQDGTIEKIVEGAERRRQEP